MSEHAPQERQNPYEKAPGMKSFILKLEGDEDKTMELHQNNTGVYLHSRQSQGDHIFVALGEQEEGGTLGFFLWKEGIGAEKFAQFLEALQKVDVPCNSDEYMSEADVQRFIDRFGYEPALDEIELETFELTPRKEREVGSLATALAMMSADELMDEFSLPQPPQRMPSRWISNKKVVEDDDSGAF